MLLSGFRYNNANMCIYEKYAQEYCVIICLYVDDIKGVEDTKKYLFSRFKRKDLGELDTILGIKVRKYNGGYGLCQSHNIEKILNKF